MLLSCHLYHSSAKGIQILKLNTTWQTTIQVNFILKHLGGFKRLQINLYQADIEKLQEKELVGTPASHVSQRKAKGAVADWCHASLIKRFLKEQASR